MPILQLLYLQGTCQWTLLIAKEAPQLDKGWTEGNVCLMPVTMGSLTALFFLYNSFNSSLSVTTCTEQSQEHDRTRCSSKPAEGFSELPGGNEHGLSHHLNNTPHEHSCIELNSFIRYHRFTSFFFMQTSFVGLSCQGPTTHC